MPGFLDLPRELRDQVYRNLIPVKRIIEAYRPRFKYTISNGGRPCSGIQEDVSDSNESCVEQGGQALSKIGTLDNNLSISKIEGDDSECSPLTDTHMESAADFGGCTDSPYEIGWDQGTRWLGTDRSKNNIFLVCKKISNEALDVLYGENAFRHFLHSDGGLCLETNFTEANRRRMRMLLLTVQHRSWIGDITPNKAIWSSIIPTLKILRLVAEQPVQATYWEASRIEKDKEMWFRFMRNFLGCFHHLLEGRLLEVDFDGKTVTREVVEECMLGGYREVRCRLSGDAMFRRGRFSRDSGGWDDYRCIITFDAL